MRTQIEQLIPHRPFDVPSLPSSPAVDTSALPMPFVRVQEKLMWEYKCIQRNLAQTQALTEEELNTLGAAGWELTAAVTDSPLIYFYFKRPVG